MARWRPRTGRRPSPNPILARGAARGWCPTRSSKPVARRSPAGGRFDSCAAPLAAGRVGFAPMEGSADERSLLIVGGGRMGEALLGGLLAGGRDAGELAVAEVSATR